MTAQTFRAMVVREASGGIFREITERICDDLPPGDILIKVHYSSLNYKDALSASGNRGVTRRYPHTPGIDAAGIVEQSETGQFRPGQEVLVTGYDLGTNTSGGFAEYIRVPAAWVVPRPSGLSLRECMILGTAGFTAGLAVLKLRQYGLSPEQGPVLVTGATGGVGCIAVAILAKEGFHVVTVTGKPEAAGFLSDLGAREILTREEATESSGKALLPGRWAGSVETVGGLILDAVIRATRPEGAVACCGNIGGAELRTSIYPFILRGVGLLGIGSAYTPMPTRLRIWEKFSAEWRIRQLEQLAHEISLDELSPAIDTILEGKMTGRVVVNMSL